MMEANNLVQVVRGWGGIFQVGEFPNEKGKLSNLCYPPSAVCIDALRGCAVQNAAVGVDVG